MWPQAWSLAVAEGVAWVVRIDAPARFVVETETQRTRAPLRVLDNLGSFCVGSERRPDPCECSPNARAPAMDGRCSALLLICRGRHVADCNPVGQFLNDLPAKWR